MILDEEEHQIHSYTVISLSDSTDSYYVHVQITTKGRFHRVRQTKDRVFIKSRVGVLRENSSKDLL